MESGDLSLETHILPVVERQVLLQRRLNDRRWSWDLDVEIAHLSLRDDADQSILAEADVQLIGSESIITNTWRWASSNVSISAPAQSLSAVRRFLELGAVTGAPEYDPAATLVVDDPEFPVRISIICVGVLNLFSWFVCPFQSGRLYVAIEGPTPALESPRDAMLVSDAVLMATNNLTFNHERAMLSYLGSPTRCGGRSMVWNLGDDRFLCSFDDMGRIVESTAEVD